MWSEIQIAVNWEIKDNKFREYYDLTGQFVFGEKNKKDYCILFVKTSRCKWNKRKLRTLMKIRVGNKTGKGETIKGENVKKGFCDRFRNLGVFFFPLSLRGITLNDVALLNKKKNLTATLYLQCYQNGVETGDVKERRLYRGVDVAVQEVGPRHRSSSAVGYGYQLSDSTSTFGFARVWSKRRHNKLQ